VIEMIELIEGIKNKKWMDPFPVTSPALFYFPVLAGPHEIPSSSLFFCFCLLLLPALALGSDSSFKP